MEEIYRRRQEEDAEIQTIATGNHARISHIGDLSENAHRSDRLQGDQIHGDWTGKRSSGFTRSEIDGADVDDLLDADDDDDIRVRNTQIVQSMIHDLRLPHHQQSVLRAPRNRGAEHRDIPSSRMSTSGGVLSAKSTRRVRRTRKHLQRATESSSSGAGPATAPSLLSESPFAEKSLAPVESPTTIRVIRDHSLSPMEIVSLASIAQEAKSRLYDVLRCFSSNETNELQIKKGPFPLLDLFSFVL